MLKKRKALIGAVSGFATLAAVASGFLAEAPHADAYTLNGQHWPNGVATINESDASWPSVWDSPATNASQEWNNAGANFRFQVDNSSSVGRLSTSNQGNSGTLASSSWSYDGGGNILNAQVVVNTYYSYNPSNPFAPGSVGPYDLQSVMAHELGHWLSLGHSTNLNNDGSKPVMYASFGQNEVRTVGSDDAAGIQAIYGAGTPSQPTATPTRTPVTSSPTPTRTPFGSSPTPTRTPFGSSPTPTRTPFGSSPTPTRTPTQSVPGPGNPTPTATPIRISLPPGFNWPPGIPNPFGASTEKTVVSYALVAQDAQSLSSDPAVSRVVIGRVKEVRPAAQIGRDVVTDAVIDVTEHLIGGSETQVVVRGLGGTVGNTTVIAEDFPTFSAGQTVLLFLTREGQLVPLDGSVFTVRGLVQGAYHIDGPQAVSALPDRTQSVASLRSMIQSARPRQ